MTGREVGLFCVGGADKSDRLRDVPVSGERVRRMTVRTAYAAAEMFAAPEIVSFLFARMTGKTGLGDLL